VGRRDDRLAGEVKLSPTHIWAGVVAVAGGLGLATNWLIETDKKMGEAGARFDSLAVRVEILETNQTRLMKYNRIRLRNGRVVQMPPQEGLFRRFLRKLF
jgi:hypothetical protein